MPEITLQRPPPCHGCRRAGTTSGRPGFEGRAFRAEEDLETLARTGILRGVPLDPGGAPYELTADGRVRLSDSSPLGPLPIDPGQGAPRP